MHFRSKERSSVSVVQAFLSLKPGFHMVATIAVIAVITVKKKRFSDRIADRRDNDRKSSISAIIFFLFVCFCFCFCFFSDRSDRSDPMETRLYCDKSMKRFAASQQRNQRVFPPRIGRRRSFTLVYLGLEPTTTLHAQHTLAFLRHTA